MAEFNRILEDAQHNRSGAAEQLAALLYDELRALARRELANERSDHTLQPTALVHEAYLRLLSGETGTFENRAHFFAAAATAIRRVLVDHARKRARAKRGGDRVRVSVDVSEEAGHERDEELLALDEALARLALFSPEKARIVELRFFAGMTHDEVARVLDVSESTVRRDWRAARAWLRGELEESR